MNLDVLLVDYFLNASALHWRYGLVVRVRGVLSGWVEMNLDDDVEERSDRCLRKSGH